MKLQLSLIDLKIAHDAVLTQEEIAKEEPDEFGDAEQITSLRERLKATIDYVEGKAAVDIEVKE